MGCVHHADYLFVCFGAKPKQRPELKISDETVSGGEKESPREREGQLVKEDARQWAEGGRRAWKQGREGSQKKSERRLLRLDELHRDRVNQREKMSALLVPFYWPFAKDTRR